MKRRHFFKSTTGIVSLLAAASGWGRQTQQAQAGVPSQEARSRAPEVALQKLMEGNQRFVRHQPQYPDQSQTRVQAVAQRQYPFATILSCADSRVPAELIFDQGLGSIFDVRLAGNIATTEAIGSIEYAVTLLGTPVLMVLGHERCGAVTAAVKNEPLPGEIGSLIKAIRPAIDQSKGQSHSAIEAAVVANVYYQIERLKRSRLLTERLQSGTLKIVGGCYDLDTGRVEIIA